ncbi:unnamed protein product [Rhodiola kirilowii]
MALDAVVFPQDPFSYNCTFKDYFQGMEDEISGGSNGGIFIDTQSSYDQLGFQEDQEDKSLFTILDNHFVNWQESSPGNSCAKNQWEPATSNSSPEVSHRVLYEMPVEEDQQKDQPLITRRKRRRTKACKNKDEVENQRMTHIAVERNRRKQMNDYLAVLRSLMPSSYAQKGDQASIIGGAINFVKKLEQLLQTLVAEKSTKTHQQQADQQPQENSHNNNESLLQLSPFSHFLTFPQYTTSSTLASTSTMDNKQVPEDHRYGIAAAADIEVTVVESHANVKILAKRCSKQLVKLVAAFQSLRLTVQHLNVSSLDRMVLYSVSVKIEEGCKLNSVDEIAAAVNQMLRNIEEESML